MLEIWLMALNFRSKQLKNINTEFLKTKILAEFTFEEPRVIVQADAK